MSDTPSSAARILLAIEQRILAEVVTLALHHGDYRIRATPSLTLARELSTSWQPHLVVLDMDLAGNAPLELECASGNGVPPPVIGLMRRDDLRTKLAAFEQGVDDILSVPFSPEELVVRVLALIRRSYRKPTAFTPVLRLGELEIDIVDRCVRASGHELRLTDLEQNLLYLLAANAGRLMTRDEILDLLWGTDFIAESNVVDRHIRNLRAKLHDDYRHPRFIATVPGKGYRFIPTATDQEHAYGSE